MSNRFFTIFGSIALAASGIRVCAAPPDLPKGAIVMFWAPWCAPCRVEIRDYAALSASAAPAPLYVVALDGGSRASIPRTVPDERVLVTRERSSEALQRWAPDEPGLPLTVAIDSRGKQCAARRGGVRVADIASMRTCALR